MNRKKIITIALVAIIAIAAIASASYAYFADTADVTNTFTVGNVTIKLNELQRDGNGGLEDFDQNKPLRPIVGSAQGEKDEFGQPTAKNYVDKMVSVTNTGSEGAYVRFYFAIPSALDDGYETFNAGKNVLHFNFGNKVVDGVITSTEGVEWNWTHDGKWNYFETVIEGISYNVYYADYTTVLPAGETTVDAVQGVYLDKSFKYDEEGNAEAFGEKLALDEGWDWSKVSCPVFSVAVQAAGFDSADEAVTAAFGANFNPWGGTATNWQ